MKTYIALRDPVASPEMECIEQADWLGLGETEEQALLDAENNWGSVKGVHVYELEIEDSEMFEDLGAGDIVFSLRKDGRLAYEIK